MLLKAINWKATLKFCGAIISGLNVDRTSIINSEK